MGERAGAETAVWRKMNVPSPLAVVRVFGKGRILSCKRARLVLAPPQVFPQLRGQTLLAGQGGFLGHRQSHCGNRLALDKARGGSQ